LAPACDPFVASRVTLTPTPDTTIRDSLHVRAVTLVDSIARSNGFITRLGVPSCRMDYRGKGTVAANWLGEQRLSIGVCIEDNAPHRLQVAVQMPGWSWTAKGDSVRRALAQAFETQFDSGTVVVGLE